MDKAICEAIKVNIKWMTDNGFVKEATKMLSDYEEKVLEDWEVYSLKTHIAEYEEEYEKALEILIEGCAHYNNNASLLYKLGNAYARLEEFSLAQNCYKQAFKYENDEKIKEMLSGILKEEEKKTTENDILEKPKGIIYIICLSQMVTGGTELLHQLCDKLSRLGCEALMYYGVKKVLIPERFKKYHTRYTMDFNDVTENIFIVPEVIPKAAFNIMYGKVLLWWLSVDNYIEGIKLIPETEENIFASIQKKEGLLHLVQSHYARDYLLGKGVAPGKVENLSDYLNKEFMVQPRKSSYGQQRYANVLYNPYKGYEFTQKLIKASPELNWIPLQNYSPEEMRIIMRRSMIYVDFGNHPGKDRIPREAAACGCCVIVGLRGAAANPYDISIPSEYKIEDKEENIAVIIEKIKQMIQNFDIISSKFDSYRRTIQEEEGVFEKDIKRILQLLCEEKNRRVLVELT